MSVLNSPLLKIILFITIIACSTCFDGRNGMSRPWIISRKTQEKGNNTSLPKTDVEIQKFLKDLNNHKKINLELFKAEDESDYEEKFMPVKIDNFAEDNDKTFQMRYLVKDKYFDTTNPKSPILFYCGNEGPITDFWTNSGFLTEVLAKKLGGLVIFGEHRFFGKSFPFGGNKDYDIQKNKFLTVEQAMADFVELLRNYKDENSLGSHPVIAFGGSYGGMLASWSRMKFPHIYAGAIASSAPILLFEDIEKIQNSFFKITTNTYRRYDAKCPTYVRSGFDALYNIRNNTLIADNILKEVNNIFKPCNEIKTSKDIFLLEGVLEDALIELSQYNYPYESGFINTTPGEPVRVACEKIASYVNKTDEFAKIDSKSLLISKYQDLSPLMKSAIGLTLGKFGQTPVDPIITNKLNYLKEASSVFFNYTGSQTCLDIGNHPVNSTLEPPNGWVYMACTEMIMPMQKDGKTDMFNPYKWDVENYSKECKSLWNADVRPKWAFNFFGGKNFATEMNNYSNIFFINGKMDPWNSGCPKFSENPSVLIYEADSAHHLDLRLPNPKDPTTIIHARKITEHLIKKWIK